MTLKGWIAARSRQNPPWQVALAAPAIVLAVASCVPAATLAPSSASALAQPTAVPPVAVIDQSEAEALIGQGAVAANAALPFAELGFAAASPFAIRGRTGLDQLRSLDCLSQAIYYEAGNESEDGQRAVAQVVLNRVRHPAWPNSVCGVVYQGPMRPGGGCQFTFTCDGSLARSPGGVAWLRARRLAAEALSGRIFAPVGLSTHYHADYVFPAWAPRLAKTTVIGAHIFYRLPGAWGRPSAFSDAYAGREPLPRPAMTMRRPAFVPAFSADVPASFGTGRGRAASASPGPGPRIDVQELDTALPQPQVREEYRNSGQWRADSPIAPPNR